MRLSTTPAVALKSVMELDHQFDSPSPSNVVLTVLDIDNGISRFTIFGKDASG